MTPETPAPTQQTPNTGASSPAGNSTSVVGLAVGVLVGVLVLTHHDHCNCNCGVL